MEKDFKTYGIAHYMAVHILSLAASISNLEYFLRDNHPEILNEGISKKFPDYEIRDLLQAMTENLEKIGEITRETDTFLFYKNVESDNKNGNI